MSSISSRIDFPVLIYSQNAPVPPGRNPNGCSQKINKVKIALRPEIDALQSGEAFTLPAQGAPKKPAIPRKRKPKSEEIIKDDVDGSPKKRRAGNKKVETDSEEVHIKPENIEENNEYEV